MARASILWGIVLVLGVAGCPGPSRPPAPDTCSQQGDAVVDSIEVGVAGGEELTGGEAPFVPLAAGAMLTGVRGGQGAFMIGWRFRLHGAAVSDCQQIALAVQPELDADLGASSDFRVAEADRPPRTYADADGARVTRPPWPPRGYFYGPGLPPTP